MSYKLGFLKLRFSVEEGSKKEKIIKKIGETENEIKRNIERVAEYKGFELKHKDY